MEQERSHRCEAIRPTHLAFRNHLSLERPRGEGPSLCTLHVHSQDPQWQLLVLSSVDISDFFHSCKREHIPTLIDDPTCPRHTVFLGESGLRRIGPTFLTTAWVYRASFIRTLLNAFEVRFPPLNPVDVWAWEVLHEQRCLRHALAPAENLVVELEISSVKHSQG